MLSLQALRQARTLAHLVLVWFVLSVGVAVAAPLVQPQSASLVCSASGAVKLVVNSDNGDAVAVGHTLDCVLCLALGAPPYAVWEAPAPLQVVAMAASACPALDPVWRTCAPLPPRGPPPSL